MVKQTRQHLPSLLLILVLVVLAFQATNLPAANAQSIPGQPVLTGPKVYLPFIRSSGVGSSNQTPVPLPSSTATPQPTATSTPRPTRTPKPTATAAPSATPSASDPVILAAGDIARCGDTGDLQTAAIISKYPTATVLALGDNAYEAGSYSDYTTCYDPAWGPFLNRTKPVLGNHEYLTAGAAGYFQYFGAVAGDPTQGFYSYNVGTWHILALNSNCSLIGGCGVGSPEESFVKADLAAHPAKCILAYWHHPRFSSGEWGSITWTQAIVNDLYNAKAELILSGHDHDYERFAPQDPSGNLDPLNGIVQFVAGTGGSNNTPWSVMQPNSLASQNTVFGVLKLTLHPGSYDWQYLPVSGSFTDSGTASCH